MLQGEDAIPNVGDISYGCTIDMPFIYLSYFTALDLSAFQADLKGGSGAISLDLELLKPFRVSAVAPERIERSAPPDSVWLEYAYRKQC